MNRISTTKLRNRTLVNELLKVVFASMIMAVSARIYIPLPFVPITGQTLGLTIIALSLGRKTALAAMLLYMAEGIMGLPVFSGARFGLPVIFGPTGGYMIGFVPAAYIMGYFSDRGCLESFAKTALAAFSGMFVIFAFGLVHLSMFIPANRLMQVGLLPFIPGGIVKSLLATLIVPSFYRFFKNRRV